MVQLAATSAGAFGKEKENRRRRQSRSRNGCASILVVLEDGRAVKGAEARDLIKARCGSSNVGHTSSWMNFCSTCRTVLRCQPALGWLGSVFSSRTGGDSDSSAYVQPQRERTGKIQPTCIEGQAEHRGCHTDTSTFASCRSANSLLCSGATSATANPHINRRSHAACGSHTHGIF